MKKFIISIIILTFILLSLSCSQADTAISETIYDKETVQIGAICGMWIDSWEDILDTADYVVKCDITDKLPAISTQGYDLEKYSSKQVRSIAITLRTPYNAKITDVYYAADEITDEIIIWQPYGEHGDYIYTYDEIVPLKENASYILALSKMYIDETPIYYLTSSSFGFAEIIKYNKKTSKVTLSFYEYNELFKDITSLNQLKQNINNAVRELD